MAVIDGLEAVLGKDTLIDYIGMPWQFFRSDDGKAKVVVQGIGLEIPAFHFYKWRSVQDHPIAYQIGIEKGIVGHHPPGLVLRGTGNGHTGTIGGELLRFPLYCHFYVAQMIA